MKHKGLDGDKISLGMRPDNEGKGREMGQGDEEGRRDNNITDRPLKHYTKIGATWGYRPKFLRI